jgi:hypothetical protein
MTATQEEADEFSGLNLAEKIKRAAAGRATLDVAQFQFIGLKEIAERYGPRWPERRERVQTVARHFIAKRIAPEDVLIPGADGFLLVFGARAGLVADAAAQRISKSLNDFFIGSDDPDIRFEAKRREMNVEDLAQAFGDVSFEDAIPAQLSADTLRCAFQPMWDARREAVTASFLAPIDPRTGERLQGWAFETGLDVVKHTLDFDEAQLKQSEEALRKLFGSGRKAFVGVAVHVSSLTNQSSLTRLFSAMAKFDRELARFRILRITGIEAGFPRIYLEDIARTLKTRAPHLSFAIHWSEPDVGSVLRLQPASVGFALPAEALGHGAPRAELIARVKQAAELARRDHAPFFVDGMIPADLAQRFLGASADWLVSPLVWPQSAEPAAAAKWPAMRLNDAAVINAA